MELEKIAAEVELLFEKLDAEISAFQAATTLHCGFGCGKCCFKPDIEATLLEFIPFTLHLYKEGKAEEWYDRLRNSDSSICLILNPASQAAGLCSEYKYRGLICRLFGYSARTNKYGKRELVTCSIIKTEQSQAVLQTEEKIDCGLSVPVIHQYYLQLTAIDIEMTRDFHPINHAIRKALEKVMHYYAYRTVADK